jgi:transposase-like protein
MSKRNINLSVSTKLAIVNRCIAHESSLNFEAKKYGVAWSTIKSWIRKYELDGIEGLKESKGWKNYTAELKNKAVESVLSGELSLLEATKKFEISSDSVLRRWISKYTNGEEIKPTSKGIGKSRMNKGRKSTFKERIEIAQFTIANDLDYQKAVETYGVSYQQVYSWVRKFKENGESALKDNRGRIKPEEDLTENERLKLRIKELEERNRHLEMEEDFAKKLDEIQRRDSKYR